MAPEQGLSEDSACGKKTNANGSSESSPRLTIDSAFNPSDSLNWVYKMRKDQLLLACEKVNINVSGQKVCDLRKSLSFAIKQQRLSKSTENLVDSIREEITLEEEDIIAARNPSYIEQQPSISEHNLQEQFSRFITDMSSNIPINESKLSTTVKSWNITYNGNDDLYSFLNRIESRAENTKISLDSLIPVLHIMLTGAAQQWYEVQGRRIKTWEEFRSEITSFFLPARFLAQIANNFYSRRQRPREKARDYILSLLTLANQHPRLKALDPTEHLKQIYDGLLPEYRLQVARNSITNISELTSKCNEYEQVREEEFRAHRHQEQRRQENRPHQTNHMLRSYNRKTHCWHCKQQGHYRRACTNPPLLFCSACGRDNTLSIQCCKKPTKSLSHPVNRLLIQIQIRNIKIHALLDTGASQTYVSQNLTHKLQEAGFHLENHNTNIQVANQQMVRTKHRFFLPITLHNKTTWQHVLIMPNLAEEFILGMDFLLSRNYKLLLDNKQIIKINHPKPSLSYLNSLLSQEDLEKEQQLAFSQYIEQQKLRFIKISGPCRIAKYTIHLKHNNPIKQRYYPKNPAMQKVIDEEIDNLLEAGRIEPSTSPYSSPIVLVRKKQGTWRMCIDYRQLNAASIPDAYPLPQIQAILDQLKEAVIISSIDLKNGYWQIPLCEKSSKYTAFTVPGRGLYQWKVMPFGLHSAPATFQRALDSLIGPELHPQIFAYLDDIIITGKTYEEHMNNLKIVCNKLYEANMQINFEKSSFAQTRVTYLGHVVSSEGIHTDPKKIEAIKQMPSPTNIKKLRRVIGVASWYRRFVPDFSTITAPLTLLLKKNQKWIWEDHQENAFLEIKNRLTTAPILHCPNFTLPFILQTDASNQGLGAVLFQRHSDQEQVIAYASRSLNSAEKNYSTTEQECLAILWGIRKMRPYLEGYHFTVITDHHSLKWLYQLQNPTGRLAQWALEMQQYDFDIEYRKGTSNVVADALSRSPITESQYDTLMMANRISLHDWVDNKKAQVAQNPGKYPDFRIIDNRLFHHIKRKNPMSPDPEWKLCVPKSRQTDVLHEIHDCPTAGHLGITKSLHRAQQNYYWPGMYRDIFKHVRLCQRCNHYKPLQQKPAGLMTTMQCSQPWEIVCADFVGPLPRSSKGNTCLLVMVDKFSKWVELTPVRQATANCVVSALKEKIIYRFGCPKIFLTDNGRQFISKELKKFLQIHNIEHRFIAPYTPQENPTERMNRVVKTMISQLCENTHRGWDKYLPEIAFAINTSVSETTKHSAVQIIYGKNPSLPNQIINEGQKPDEPMSSMQTNKMWQKIQTYAQEAAAKQQKYYNQKRRQWKPKIGDKSWSTNAHVRYHSAKYSRAQQPKQQQQNHYHTPHPQKPAYDHAHWHQQLWQVTGAYK